jgi:hypothetical protein
MRGFEEEEDDGDLPSLVISRPHVIPLSQTSSSLSQLSRASMRHKEMGPSAPDDETAFSYKRRTNDALSSDFAYNCGRASTADKDITTHPPQQKKVEGRKSRRVHRVKSDDADEQDGDESQASAGGSKKRRNEGGGAHRRGRSTGRRYRATNGSRQTVSPSRNRTRAKSAADAVTESIVPEGGDDQGGRGVCCGELNYQSFMSILGLTESAPTKEAITNALETPSVVSEDEKSFVTCESDDGDDHSVNYEVQFNGLTPQPPAKTSKWRDSLRGGKPGVAGTGAGAQQSVLSNVQVKPDESIDHHRGGIQSQKSELEELYEDIGKILPPMLGLVEHAGPYTAGAKSKSQDRESSIPPPPTAREQKTQHPQRQPLHQQAKQTTHQPQPLSQQAKQAISTGGGSKKNNKAKSLLAAMQSARLQHQKGTASATQPPIDVREDDEKDEEESLGVEPVAPSMPKHIVSENNKKGSPRSPHSSRIVDVTPSSKVKQPTNHSSASRKTPTMDNRTITITARGGGGAQRGQHRQPPKRQQQQQPLKPMPVPLVDDEQTVASAQSEWSESQQQTYLTLLGHTGKNIQENNTKKALGLASGNSKSAPDNSDEGVGILETELLMHEGAVIVCERKPKKIIRDKNNTKASKTSQSEESSQQGVLHNSQDKHEEVPTKLWKLPIKEEIRNSKRSGGKNPIRASSLEKGMAATISGMNSTLEKVTNFSLRSMGSIDAKGEDKQDLLNASPSSNDEIDVNSPARPSIAEEEEVLLNTPGEIEDDSSEDEDSDESSSDDDDEGEVYVARNKRGKRFTTSLEALPEIEEEESDVDENDKNINHQKDGYEPAQHFASEQGFEENLKDENNVLSPVGSIAGSSHNAAAGGSSSDKSEKRLKFPKIRGNIKFSPIVLGESTVTLFPSGESTDNETTHQQQANAMSSNSKKSHHENNKKTLRQNKFSFFTPSDKYKKVKSGDESVESEGEEEEEVVEDAYASHSPHALATADDGIDNNYEITAQHINNNGGSSNTKKQHHAFSKPKLNLKKQSLRLPRFSKMGSSTHAPLHEDVEDSEDDETVTAGNVSPGFGAKQKSSKKQHSSSEVDHLLTSQSIISVLHFDTHPQHLQSAQLPSDAADTHPQQLPSDAADTHPQQLPSDAADTHPQQLSSDAASDSSSSQDSEDDLSRILAQEFQDDDEILPPPAHALTSVRSSATIDAKDDASVMSEMTMQTSMQQHLRAGSSRSPTQQYSRPKKTRYATIAEDEDETDGDFADGTAGPHGRSSGALDTFLEVNNPVEPMGGSIKTGFHSVATERASVNSKFAHEVKGKGWVASMKKAASSDNHKRVWNPKHGWVIEEKDEEEEEQSMDPRDVSYDHDPHAQDGGEGNEDSFANTMESFEDPFLFGGSGVFGDEQGMERTLSTAQRQREDDPSAASSQMSAFDHVDDDQDFEGESEEKVAAEASEPDQQNIAARVSPNKSINKASNHSAPEQSQSLLMRKVQRMLEKKRMRAPDEMTTASEKDLSNAIHQMVKELPAPPPPSTTNSSPKPDYSSPKANPKPDYSSSPKNAYIKAIQSAASAPREERQQSQPRESISQTAPRLEAKTLQGLGEARNDQQSDNGDEDDSQSRVSVKSKAQAWMELISKSAVGSKAGGNKANIAGQAQRSKAKWAQRSLERKASEDSNLQSSSNDHDGLQHLHTNEGSRNSMAYTSTLQQQNNTDESDPQSSPACTNSSKSLNAAELDVPAQRRGIGPGEYISPAQASNATPIEQPASPWHRGLEVGPPSMYVPRIYNEENNDRADVETEDDDSSAEQERDASKNVTMSGLMDRLKCGVGEMPMAHLAFLRGNMTPEKSSSNDGGESDKSSQQAARDEEGTESNKKTLKLQAVTNAMMCCATDRPMNTIYEDDDQDALQYGEFQYQQQQTQNDVSDLKESDLGRTISIDNMLKKQYGAPKSPASVSTVSDISRDSFSDFMEEDGTVSDRFNKKRNAMSAARRVDSIINSMPSMAQAKRDMSKKTLH